MMKWIRQRPSLSVAASLSLLAIMLTSCSSPRLYARVEKLSLSGLVSEPLETPDPATLTPPSGQRLIVSWLLNPFLGLRDCYLDVEILSLKAHHLHYKVPINRYWGHWEYEISQRQIDQGGGLATYRLEIVREGVSVSVFEHKLYKPLIDIEELVEDQDPVF